MLGYVGQHPVLFATSALENIKVLGDGRNSIPSGELTFCHGKSPFLMGKSTISMAIFPLVNRCAGHRCPFPTGWLMKKEGLETTP